MVDFLIILLGLALAILGARFLVDGGVAIARRFDVPTVVIGSTVVAFGTSMPEFTVNVQSAVAGNTDLALGNILGSNLFNIAAIIGIVALLSPLNVSRDSAVKDFPMCLVAALMVGVCGNQLYFDHINYHELMPSHGIIFLCFFAIFAYYTYQEATAGATHKRTTHTKALEEHHDAKGIGLVKAIVLVFLGLLGLIAGGDFIVDGATGVAKSFGLSGRVIGLVIVGPGTSVPELIASIVAALKKKSDMVIGNILGSNIFNVFFTLGATALIKPVPLDLALNSAVVSNIVITLFVVLYVLIGRPRPIGRGVGAILIAAYVGYIAYSMGG